jgi:hypothetical protein
MQTKERFVDWFDRLALHGRRYERRRSAVTGSTGLHLAEVLQIFRRKTILEMDVRATGEAERSRRHRVGSPISLVDGLAEIHGGAGSSFEVLETAPSGDFSRVRIVARPGGSELSMLVAERQPEHHASEDQVLDALHDGSLEMDVRRTN